jgi:exodeoxyribonuclease VII large subunit
VEVLLSSVHVQGQYAVPEILEAFRSFQSLPLEERPDVLVLTRGGGSLEDLHAFNDEQVARAVFQCGIPVVVGVGHERDESLCDFVADVRASTPSNAAERVVPDRHDVARQVDMAIGRAEDVLRMRLDRQRHGVDRSLGILEKFLMGKTHQVKMTVERFGHAFDRFRLSLVATRQYLERAESIVSQSFTTQLDRAKQMLQSTVRLFESFDIQRVLDRGYGIVRANGKTVRDASALAPGLPIQIQLARGKVEAEVTGKKQQAKLI